MPHYKYEKKTKLLSSISVGVYQKNWGKNMSFSKLKTIKQDKMRPCILELASLEHQDLNCLIDQINLEMNLLN